jgi:hypothetical protein
MDQNPNNFLALNNILADVQVILNDEDNRLLTPGFYRAQAKLALDELGFDIDFLPQTNDYPLPSDLLVDIPVGCFNLKAISIYSGTPEAVGYVEDVHWRKDVQTRGAGTGVTAGVNSYNITDPFFRVRVWESGLYYFSVQNGIIRLSDACSGFAYVRLTYSGVPSMNLDEVKMIPRECRKAIVDWATDRCAGALKMRDARYRIIQSDAQRSLDEYGFNGSWHQAKQRLLKLDSKKLKDVILYNSKLNY